MSYQKINYSGRPIVFGEVLFDLFADQSVLGGTSFNVAWNLQGFGLNPLFISRVGSDGYGDEIIKEMKKWGLDTRGVQRDEDHSTGVVLVKMEGNKHTFEIKRKVAYDFIDSIEAAHAIENVKASLLCFNSSLALRGPVSAEALLSIKEQLKTFSFVDVNIRLPWWKDEYIDSILMKSKWIKLNEDELDMIEPGSESNIVRAEELRKKLNVELLFLTIGSEGAVVISKKGSTAVKPKGGLDIIDTVGAGDAFTATTILGIIKGWNEEKILKRSMEFAAAVCSVRGALITNKSVYQKFLKEWNVE